MKKERFEIVAVGDEHLEGLRELASHLNTVNLPDDPAEIAPLIEHSKRSFAGELDASNEAEFRFVLIDRENDDRVCGTSLIVSQLGRRGVPYIYFDVHTEERYSGTLDRLFKHKVLSIGYSYDGPTELGGLVMHPEYRRKEVRLGQFISFVRFMWIAMHRGRFQDTILAELLPPLEADGTSHLWEAVGRKFTDMSYREADHLSKKNKEFIRGLFPDGFIYASLLSEKAQSVIGQVGEQTKGVERMLRRLGFRYANRVDPFDGGPHFTAPTDSIGPVRDSARYRLIENEPTNPDIERRGMIAVDYEVAPYFRAQRGDVKILGNRIWLDAVLREDLGIKKDDWIWFLQP